MGLELGCSFPWEGESDAPALAAPDSTVGRIYHEAPTVSCEVLDHHLADHGRKAVASPGNIGLRTLWL